MGIDTGHLAIVLLLGAGFALAGLFGYFAKLCKLSPILGYLLAGYLIGPYSPGFTVDTKISEQLAEVGVILMMFGIGLHFKFYELMRVKRIAIPGAVGQTLIASLVGAWIVVAFGWPLITGIIIGLSIGVASTVVLVRMLTDNGLLKTTEGHIAVGWLIVEDIITVFLLILLPTLTSFMQGEGFSYTTFATSIGMVLIKLLFLALILFFLGRRVTSFLLKKVEKTESHELYTISVLALIFAIATVSAVIFGVSIALGAFIAGMVIGQTEGKEKAFTHSLPLRDAFVAIFFISVGMLFNPNIIAAQFKLFLVILAIILVLKPLTAFVIAVLLRYPMKTAIVVAVALGQIGEFSFILSEEAMKFNLLSDEGYDLIVACALISIALNPLLFKMIHRSREV